MLAFIILAVLWFRPRWSFLAGWTAAFAVIMTAILWASYGSLTEGAADHLALADVWVDLVDRAATNVLVFVVLGSGIVLLRKWMQGGKQRAVDAGVNRSSAGSVSGDAPNSVEPSAGDGIQPPVPAQTSGQGGAAAHPVAGPKPEPGVASTRPEASRSWLQLSDRMNWRRGLARVFWLMSGAWWIAAVVLVGSIVAPFPQRAAFFPECTITTSSDDWWRHGCGIEPIRPRSGPRFLGDPEAPASDQEAVRNWEEGRNQFAACVATNESERAAEIRRCEERRASVQGQREVDATHRNAVTSWTGQLVMLVAMAACVPFVFAALMFGFWRVGRWVWDGFKGAG